jgi:endo-1,4-beta-xylanase
MMNRWRLGATAVGLALLVSLWMIAHPAASAAGVQLQTATLNPTPEPEHSLKGYAGQRGLWVGAAVDLTALLNEPDYRDLLVREYHMLTPENAFKLRELSSAPGVYDFSGADALVDFAQANGLKIRATPLIWYQGLPKWLQDVTLPREEAITLMRRHIHTLMGRYRGQIYAWDVVNEAVSIDGNGLRQESVWLQSVGADYIPLAFRFAREADPDALLFYSDYNADDLDPKANTVYELVKGLLADGVPLDGVALHMHLRLGALPDWNAVAQNIQRLNALGLQVQISELDVRIQDAEGTLEERLNQQAQVYGQVFALCLAAEQCSGITTWGFTDRHSWIPEFTGNPDAALPFDADLQPKPAYFAMLDALRE